MTPGLIAGSVDQILCDSLNLKFVGFKKVPNSKGQYSLELGNPKCQSVWIIGCKVYEF